MARSMRSSLTASIACVGGLGGRDLELVVEAELLGERVAQIPVVVDDEEAAGIRHQEPFNAGMRASARVRLVIRALTTRGGSGPSTGMTSRPLAADPGLPLAPRPPPRPPRRGQPGAALRARPLGHAPREARGRRRLAGRPLPRCCRPSTAPTAARARGRRCPCGAIRPRGRLVRRPGGPALQPSGAAPLRGRATRTMWRDDHLYDVVLDIGWNRGPIVPRPRQRDLPAPRQARIRADGRLRRGRRGAAIRRLLERHRAAHADRDRGLRSGLPPDGGSARSEDRAPDAHMGRAELDRGLEIRAHAHRQAAEPVAARRSR